MMRFSQHIRKMIGLAAFLASSFASNVYASCDIIKDVPATVCTVDPVRDDLRVFWLDPKGEPFALFRRLADTVAGMGAKLTFAMNAGMFQPDLSPVGLFVEGGQQRRPVNLHAGGGNFGMRPNGVFWLEGSRAGVTETQRFVALGIRPTYATQSGPLLVAGGRIHPKIRADGTSAKIRNGVGVCEDGRVRFVISDSPVTFFQFATLFRDRLKCPDALYLDGSISALYAPALGREDGWRAMGPMIGVVEKK